MFKLQNNVKANILELYGKQVTLELPPFVDLALNSFLFALTQKKKEFVEYRYVNY